MKPIFITATNTNIGKTYTTLQLIRELSSRGYRVGVFKPIETGVVDEPLDAKMLLEEVAKYNENFTTLQPKDITAYTFELPAAPFCASRDINIETIKAKYQELSSLCDILLVEGAGGLMVPILQDYYVIDLIKEFDAKALLVTASKLGTINDTMLSMEALKNREIAHSWAVNLYENKESFDEVTKPFFDVYFTHYYSVQEDMGRVVDELLK
ncbi:MAG: dethiobiotin synthase [Campylobacterota bacterium]|nr:dethiobiotin synthase [Campylobacterota bacterium]